MSHYSCQCCTLPGFIATSLGLFFGSFFLCVPAFSAPPLYHLTDLSALATNALRAVHAYEINNRGEVVGAAVSDPADGFHAFLYSDGALSDLGNLDSNPTAARDINDSGQIIGYSTLDTVPYALRHPFLASNGSLTDLGSLRPETFSATEASAYAINSSGQVVGASSCYGQPCAFLYTNGAMTDLSSILGSPPRSTALDINNHGQVVGRLSMSFDRPIYRAFLYSDGSVTDLGFPAGTYPWQSAVANAINDNGDIVGYWGGSCINTSNVCELQHAFLRKDNALIELRLSFNPAWVVTDSVANDINNSGSVIGNFYAERIRFGLLGAFRAFLYEDGAMYNLQDLVNESGAGWSILEANAINDAGWIVGRGYYDGEHRAILLTPVPEPTAYLLLALGIICLSFECGRIGRRRWLPAMGFVATIAAVSPMAHAVTIETVPVGNPANPSDSFGIGSVGYSYQIGKYEVTNAQYVEFLNSVDPTGMNALSLYDSWMTSEANGGIVYNSAAASCSKYGLKSGRGNNPVTSVTFYDTLRFTNWLNNGMSAGGTETGAYTLLGGTATPSNSNNIARNPGAQWFLPTWDEWYKAAYHKNDGITGNYWDYPTSHDFVPYTDQPPGTGAPDPTNTINARKNDSIRNGFNDGFAVTGSDIYSSSQNYLSDVGAYSFSPSPYGTFDQGGNVWEWVQQYYAGTARGIRGGSWLLEPGASTAALNVILDAYESGPSTGFRVATLVPEPSAIGILGIGVMTLAVGRRRIKPRSAHSQWLRRNIAGPNSSYFLLFDGHSNGKRTNILSTLILYTAALVALRPVAAAPIQGSLVGWGYNNYGQANVPAGSDYRAVAAGWYHSLALRADGSLVGWGHDNYGQASAPAGNDFVAIAAGYEHSLALKSDGSLAAWGFNNWGQTNVPLGNDFVAIAAGVSHNLALRSDGSIVRWGIPTEANVPIGNDFVDLSAGTSFGLALKSDGSLVGWGNNNSGQTNVPAGNDFTAIATGNGHGLALRSNGSLAGWGGNMYGQADVPVGTDFRAVSAGFIHSLALKSDGSLISWGYNNYGQTNVPLGNNFVAINAGFHHSLAIQHEVPEPACLLLLAIGFTGLSRSRIGFAGRIGTTQFVLANVIGRA